MTGLMTGSRWILCSTSILIPSYKLGGGGGGMTHRSQLLVFRAIVFMTKTCILYIALRGHSLLDYRLLMGPNLSFFMFAPWEIYRLSRIYRALLRV